MFIDDNKDLIVTVHVDDLRIFGRSEDGIAQFKKAITKEFDMTDEGKGTVYLGMHVEQSPGQVKLHQVAYIRKILDRFNFQNITPVRTPCDPNVKLQKETTKEATDAFKHKYLQMFGSLNYLPSISRPDLAYATGLIGRYNANPNQTHMDAATRMYAYLKDTINRGICYTKDAPELKGFVDSDYGGCYDTAKSTTGWVYILGGSPISWSSRRQQTVSLSLCEAEYVAATEAAKEAIWIKGFINNLRLPDYHVDTVPLHIDNNSAYKLAKNPEMHQRTKHIAIRHHFIRQCVEEGEILLTWIKGTNNVADAFTKPLARPMFESFLKDMRIIDMC